MKLAIAALLAGSAVAFAPSGSKARMSTAVQGYENEIGVIRPTGYFDPYGLAADIDQDTFDKYRAAELKHGRVAMLAVCGYVAAEIWRWPGNIAYGLPFADVPNGLAAFGSIPVWGWIQMIFFVGTVETYGWLGDFEIGKLPGLESQYLSRRKLAELQVSNNFARESQEPPPVLASTTL